MKRAREGTHLVPRGVLLLDEASLVLVTVATTIGLSRLFRDDSYLGRCVLFAVISHVLAAACRRNKVHLGLSALISAAGAVITATLVLYPSTAWAIFPTNTTRHLAGDHLGDAWDLFGTVRAPAPVEPGFLLAAGLALWVVAFLADWAAFRLWSTVEALLPASIVFLFAAMLGRGQNRFVSTVYFGAAVLLFALVHRMAKGEISSSWLARDPNDGRYAVIRMGASVAVIGVLLGLVIGPALPGAADDPILSWRDLDGGGSGQAARVTVSPLVDIRARLVTQSSQVVFTVDAAEPDYWRLTALDKFDGTAWTSSGTYEKAKEQLPTKLPANTPVAPLRQTFTIKALAALWLPAAYEPATIVDDGDTGARYEVESGTLTVKESKATSDGLTYTIESRRPQRSATQIKTNQVAGAPSADFIFRYTDLPSSVSGFVRSWLNGSRPGGIALPPELRGLRDKNTFDQAKAVQDYFRTFRYDLQVAAGHSINDVQSFLRARTGYCEQFAGTFAAIMRTLGVPARVAVGFTPGELRDGNYVVRGEHAHAWPEVYFEGVGWVRFEPTPGRGAPGDTEVTGAAPSQATSNAPDVPEAITTTTQPSTSDPGATPLPDDLPSDLIIPGGDTASGQGGGTSSIEGVGQLFVIVLLAAAIGAILFGLVPFLKFWRRRARRARAQGKPRRQVGVAWDEAVESLALLGVPVDRAATPHEVVRRTTPRLGTAAEPLANLAELITEAGYGAEEPDASRVAQASTDAGVVRAYATSQAGVLTRARQALDPRPLLQRDND